MRNILIWDGGGVGGKVRYEYLGKGLGEGNPCRWCWWGQGEFATACLARGGGGDGGSAVGGISNAVVYNTCIGCEFVIVNRSAES